MQESFTPIIELLFRIITGEYRVAGKLCQFLVRTLLVSISEMIYCQGCCIMIRGKYSLLVRHLQVDRIHIQTIRGRVPQIRNAMSPEGPQEHVNAPNRVDGLYTKRSAQRWRYIHVLFEKMLSVYFLDSLSKFLAAGAILIDNFRVIIPRLVEPGECFCVHDL